MSIHFVYSVPAAGRSARLSRRLAEMAQQSGFPLPMLAQREGLETSRWPFQAPFSITSHVYRALSARTRTLLYHMNERLLIRGGPQDILLGHPVPMLESAVWNRSCREGEFAARIALVPIHHGLPEICRPMDPYMAQIDLMLGITGPYWYDTWEKSALAHWKRKIVPVDMAIDIRHYPRVKHRFNPKGKRKFLFIGNAQPYKGAHLLSILFGQTPYRCVWIGEGGLPNLECRRPTTLTPAYMAQIAEECDFFLTMGVSDANPTTILEAMAWGFPVSCTPQSGYYAMPEIRELSTTDMAHNLEVLEHLQHADEDELLAQADAARHTVETRFTWERFVRTVVTGVEQVAIGKSLDLWPGIAQGHAATAHGE